MGWRQIHRTLKAEGVEVNLKTVHQAMRVLGTLPWPPGRTRASHIPGTLSILTCCAA
jgi:hypothetical protein